MIAYESLIDTGILGVVLAWFMFRMETKMKENTIAFNELVVFLKTKRR